MRLSKQLSLENFIRTVFLNDLRKMIYKANLHYLGFSNIAIGIEFLGACSDDHPFNESGHSKERFKVGIEDYLGQIDPAYSTYNQKSSPFYLYRNLRCGMAHLVRPQGKVYFTSRQESIKDRTKYLSVDEGRLILICEDFYDHFAESCKLLIKKLPELPQLKLKKPYLSIRSYQ